MSDIPGLFSKNRAWSENMRRQDPGFFERLARLQAPQYLWIGCADSRVPANEIMGLLPGEMFVHRNIANVVVHADLNALSVIQFAVDMLQVRHIMVVGHYGCGGVRATLDNLKIGLADNWLRHVQDVQLRHKPIIEAAAPEARVDLLCELNVIEQVVNVCRTTVVQDAWARGQQLKVHGWVYGLKDGIVNDLDLTVDQPTVLDEGYARCHENIRRRYDVLNVK